MAVVTDDDPVVEALAAQLWGMNLDRDAVSIARDLAPLVRSLAPTPLVPLVPCMRAPGAPCPGGICPCLQQWGAQL